MNHCAFSFTSVARDTKWHKESLETARSMERHCRGQIDMHLRLAKTLAGEAGWEEYESGRWRRPIGSRSEPQGPVEGDRK